MKHLIVEGRQHHAVDRVGWIRGWLATGLALRSGNYDVSGNAARCLRALPKLSLRELATLQENIVWYIH